MGDGAYSTEDGQLGVVVGNGEVYKEVRIGGDESLDPRGAVVVVLVVGAKVQQHCVGLEVSVIEEGGRRPSDDPLVQLGHGFVGVAAILIDALARDGQGLAAGLKALTQLRSIRAVMIWLARGLVNLVPSSDGVPNDLQASRSGCR